jgi:hypothetical protein
MIILFAIAMEAKWSKIFANAFLNCYDFGFN